MNPPSLREQIAGRCVHFNGVQNDKCCAGIAYQQFRVDGPYQLPCIRHKTFAGQERPDCQPCEKQQMPTAEEVDKEIAESEAQTDKFMKLGPLIRSMKTKYRQSGFAGVVECPVCKGKLHMSVSSYNGHTRGKCETENCVAWIE